MSPHVGVVVLNYNRAADTVACVQSLQACQYDNLDILVVDNGSTDGSADEIGARLPGVQVLPLGSNLGFAAGNNRGIDDRLRRGCHYVLVLNNDTVVEPGFLGPLVAALERTPNAAAATGTIYLHPEVEVLWYGGGTFSPWRSSGFSRGSGRRRPSVASTAEQSVSFVSGCLMLLRASAIERFGGFDERFFMYCEDTELSARFTGAGQTLLFVPGSRIYHKVRHRNESPMSLYFTVRNRLLLADLRIVGVRRPAAKVYVHVVHLVKMVFWGFRKPELFDAALKAFVDYHRRHFFAGRGLLLGSHQTR